MSEDLEFAVDVPIAEPTPIDGVALKDAVASDYRRGYWTTRGELIPRAAAEELAADDCRIAERYESEHRRTYAPPPASIAPKMEVAHTEAEKAGGTFEKRTVTAEHDDMVPEPSSVLSQDKATALNVRVNMLCGSDAAGPHYPKWSELVREELINCSIGRREYRYCISPKQRARVFARRLEDICDKSNGIPGVLNWWVK